MFERYISTEEISEVILTGETTEDYPDDDPLPSRLLTAIVDGRTLSVVIGYNTETETAVVITVWQVGTRSK